MPPLEICTFSLTSALTAQTANATSLELCANQSVGGTTPSIGLITLVRAQVSLPINVMIRPRGGDFLYSETEFEVMCADIDAVKASGVEGVVLGVLKSDGTVDEERTRVLVQRARPLKVTFHRAFDMTRNPYEALEAVIRSGADRVLTSGQKQRAFEGWVLLEKLVKQSKGRIEIVAGSGVGWENVEGLLRAGVDGLHMSGSTRRDGGMEFRRGDVSMISAVGGEYERVEADAEKIGRVVEMLRNLENLPSDG